MTRGAEYRLVPSPAIAGVTSINMKISEKLKSIYAHTERAGCEVIELNVQADHVHLLVKIPPKVSVSDLVGRVKGKTAIQAFQKFPSLRTKKYLGESFLVSRLLC